MKRHFSASYNKQHQNPNKKWLLAYTIRMLYFMLKNTSSRRWHAKYFCVIKILQEREIVVIKSENGKNALEMLEQHPDIDLVLMDIMMPNGWLWNMKRIRSQIKFKRLPVIALTANNERWQTKKCIDAGANDYITKPIDVDRLLSLMRVWLSK
jgi:CheY-like chemotaxis protein